MYTTMNAYWLLCDLCRLPRRLHRISTGLAHRFARGRTAGAAVAAASLLLFASAAKTAYGFRCLSSTSNSSARGGIRPLHTRMMSASTHAGNGDGGVRLPEPLMFGPYPITEDQVFYSSQLSMAIVNLKPIVPGHVLIMPHRVAVRFADLSPEEVADLYLSVHEIAPRLEQHYRGKALTISIQDGAAAGQTVPHVHVHVLPRRLGDFVPNDKVYEELEAVHLKRHFDLDAERRPRTSEEMAAEARELRALFPARQWQQREAQNKEEER